MRLSLFTQRLPDLIPFLERVPVPYVLAVDPDPASVVRCRELGVRVIGRMYHQQYDGGSPQTVGNPAMYAALLLAQPWIDDVWGVTLPNEPHPGDAAWMAQVVRLVRSVKPHLTVLVGCWGNGWDGFPVPVADQDREHIAYSSHEYGDPRDPRLIMSGAPWMALRYRSWFPRVLAVQPEARLMVTELGLTQAAADPPGPDIGWLHESQPVSATAYWQSIGKYLYELAQDSYMEAAFLYEAGAVPPWTSFEIMGTRVMASVEEYNTTPATGNTSESPLGQPGGIVEEETSMGPEIKDTYAPMFESWWYAGGWRNFASFLVATGQMQTTDAERRELVKDRLSSSAKETQEFLDSLPLT